MTKEIINFEDFIKIDMRLVTILEVSMNKKSRNTYDLLKIYLGANIRTKKSSAQTTNYS